MGVELVQLSNDGLALRWGEDGAEYAFEDETSAELAYRKCLAEAIGNCETIVDDRDRDGARELGEGIGVRKDAGGNLIIAWWPPAELAQHLKVAIPGALIPEDLHLTLVFLGDPADYDVSLVAAACKIFTRWRSPVPARVAGVGRFVLDDQTDAIVALVDSPCVDDLREAICCALANVGVYPAPAEHGFVPHLTLAYVARSYVVDAYLDDLIDFELDNVTVAAGSTRLTFPFESFGADAEADQTPYLAARDMEKAGRIVSGKNMTKLKDAVAALQAVIDAEETRRLADEAAAAEKASNPDLEYAVTKANDEMRLTVGPVYAPDRLDAHGEFTDPDTLEKAVYDYVRESAATGRRLLLQHGAHGEDVTVGEWVSIMPWPYEHTIKVQVPGEAERELDMPANTVYMGVIWDESAWPLVKSGALRGYSLGGKAVRVATTDELTHMGDKLAAAAAAAAAAEDEVEKFKPHPYVPQEDGGGTCKVCKMSRGEGNHVAKGADAASGPDPLALLEDAAEALRERTPPDRVDD